MKKLPGRVESNALLISVCSKDSESAAEPAGSSLRLLSLSSTSISCWAAVSSSWLSFIMIEPSPVSAGKGGGVGWGWGVGGGGGTLNEIYRKKELLNKY